MISEKTNGGILRKSNKAYKGAKRSRELLRQQRKEEKRRRRLAKDKTPEEGGGLPPSEETPESQPL
jgi:hypothetical protein